MRKMFAVRLLALLALFLLALPTQAQPAANPPIGWLPGRSGIAPMDADYFTLTTNTALTNERVLTFSVPQFSVADNGAGNTYVVSLGPILSYWYGTGATTNQQAFDAISSLPSAATGDTFYKDSASTIARRAIGSPGDVYTVSGGVPTWQAPTSGAPQNAQYILGTNDATLTQDRAWNDGSGITHTDGGANSTWTVGVDSTVIRTTGAQSMSGPKTLSGGPIITGMNSTGLVLTGSSFSSTIQTDPAANRTLTIPDPGGAASFVMTAGNQTIAGVKTLSSSPVLSTNAITGSGANTVTFFTSSDTVVGKNTNDVLTSKELTSPSLTNNATGLTMKGSGSNTFVHTWSPGGAGQTLTWPDPNGNADVAYKTGACAAGGIAYGIGNNQFSVTSAGTSGQAVISGGAGAPTMGVLGISGGGTNNGSLGVSALGIYNGDGSKVVQTTAAASQSWRVNAGGTAVEAFTPGTGTVTSVGLTGSGISNILTISGSPVTTSGNLTLTASGTTGDLPYISSSNTFNKLGIGSTGNLLQVASGIPAWTAPTAFQVLKRKASDTSRNTTTTVADDPHLLFAVGANETWDFTAIINFTQANNVPDLKYTFAGPSGSTVTYAGNYARFTSGGSNGGALIAGTAGGTTNTVDFGTAEQPMQLTISGKCSNGATPGNLSFQWAQNTSNGSNVTAVTGSWLQGIRE